MWQNTWNIYTCGELVCIVLKILMSTKNIVIKSVILPGITWNMNNIMLILMSWSIFLPEITYKLFHSWDANYIIHYISEFIFNWQKFLRLLNLNYTVSIIIQYISLSKFQNQGQFWKPENMQIIKLSPILKID